MCSLRIQRFLTTCSTIKFYYQLLKKKKIKNSARNDQFKLLNLTHPMTYIAKRPKLESSDA